MKATSTPARKKTGRPSKLSPELTEEICRRIASGQSLRGVCLADDMPDVRTAMRWACDNEEFRHQYARACSERADAMAEELLEIADDGRNDFMEREDPDNPGYTFNGEHVQRSKLRVDARKWLLAKMAPKKYGDKIQTEVSGPDGGPIEVADAPARDYDAIRRKIAERKAAAGG